MIRVLVWNEFMHEKSKESVRAIYPNGIHQAIADFLQCDDITVKTAWLEMENCGITDGFTQERTSAREEYTPDFDLSGI